MKKHRVLKLIILCVLLPVCAISTIVGGFFAFVWVGFRFETKEYHRPSIVYGLPDYVFQDSDGKTCFIKNNRIYRVTNDESIEKIEINYDDKNELTMSCCYADDSYIYSFLTLIGKSVVGIDRIVIIDKSLQISKTIYTEDFIRSMVVDGDNLYYCYEYVTSNNDYNNQHCYGLAKYNLSTSEKTLLQDKIDLDCPFSNDNITLFLESSNYVYLRLTNVSEGTYLTWNGNFSAYHSNFGTVHFSLDNECLIAKLSNKELSFKLPYKKASFYNCLYMKDECALFGISECLENKECMPHYTDRCICHFGRSSLFKLDFNSGELSTVSNYETGTVLIDYDENGSKYYYNGGLYNHESFINSCPIIKPSGEITIKGDNYSTKDGEHWIFLFDYLKAKAFVV